MQCITSLTKLSKYLFPHLGSKTNLLSVVQYLCYISEDILLREHLFYLLQVASIILQVESSMYSAGRKLNVCGICASPPFLVAKLFIICNESDL